MANKSDGVLFNVKIGGVSIGITAVYQEAEKWLAASMSSMKKEIVPFRDNCADIRARLTQTRIAA